MRTGIRMSKRAAGLLLPAAVGLFFAGCATIEQKPKSALVATDRGTAIYEDKYEFKPPFGWKVLRNVSGGDFEFGFWIFEKGGFPSQTTIIYDPNPYGSSQDLDTRAKQYCTRFLWNSGIAAEVKKQEKTEVLGNTAVLMELMGENPNRNEKSESLVYLIKTGSRVISFVITQWRPMDGSFSQEPFEKFETFVRSFKFLKKTFYEEMEEKIKKLEG